jgi:hypothetical protein
LIGRLLQASSAIFEISLIEAMASNSDILLRYNGENAKIKIDDGRFAIRLKDSGSLDWASEKYGGIESGSLRDLGGLIEDHEELRRKGEFALVGLEFNHKGKERAILGELSDSIRIKDNGSVVLEGRTVDDIETLDGLDHIDRVGSQYAKLHNTHNDKRFSIGSRDIQLHIDTHTGKELTHLHGGVDDIPDFYSLGEQETSLRYALTGLSDDLTTRDQLKVIDFSKDYTVGPATLNLKANVTPSVDASFNVPDSWWKVFNPDQYSLVASLKLDWDASATLTTGADDGKFQLPSQTWEGPSVTIPIATGLSAKFGSGLEFNSSLTLPGLAKSYTLGASQTLGKKFTVKTSGVSTENLSTDVSPTLPSFDPITGLELEAVATPYVDLAVGMLVPSSVPSWGGKSLADITGKFSVPVTFNFKLEDSNTFTVGVGAALSASVNALTFKDSWAFTKELASGSIFDWTSPNLIA